MIAKLKFNLEDEEDRRKFQEIAKDDVGKLKAAMHEFSEQVLRKYRKYGFPIAEIPGFKPADEELNRIESTAQHVVEHLEKKFYECLSEYEATVE